MPSGITKRVRERKKAILELLADGCKTTTYIMRTLGTTHVETYYALKTLAHEGYIKEWIIGKSAVWCINDDEYNNLIGTILQEIQKIVESYNLKYVYPTRLYRLIQKDHKVLKLIAELMPADYRNASVLSFLNWVLRIVYGEPYTKGKKTVYFVYKSSIKPPNN
jgi:hypothetical protein